MFTWLLELMMQWGCVREVVTCIDVIIANTLRIRPYHGTDPCGSVHRRPAAGVVRILGLLCRLRTPRIQEDDNRAVCRQKYDTSRLGVPRYCALTTVYVLSHQRGSVLRLAAISYARKEIRVGWS